MKVLLMNFLGFPDENDIKHEAISSIFIERTVCSNHVFIRKNRLNWFVSWLTNNPWMVTLSSRCNEKFWTFRIQYWMTQVAVDRGCTAAALFHSHSVHIVRSPCQAVRARALIGVNLFGKQKSRHSWHLLANRYTYVREETMQLPDDLKQHFNR